MTEKCSTDPGLIDALRAMRAAYPDWRIGQLICNVVTLSGNHFAGATWDITDDEFVRTIRAHLASRAKGDFDQVKTQALGRVNQPTDELYRQLLHAGFLFLREASAARNLDWVNAEIEFLHNVPSLISEPNWLRHEYFWVGERSMYMEWAARANIPLQQSLMRSRYIPIWDELEKIFKSHSGS